MHMLIIACMHVNFNRKLLLLCIHTRTHLHKHTHTRTHVHTYTHIHTHVPSAAIPLLRVIVPAASLRTEEVEGHEGLVCGYS